MNRKARRAGFCRLLFVSIPFYSPLTPPFLLSGYAPVAHYLLRKPCYFYLQSSIAGYPSGQGPPNACCRKIFLSDFAGERISRSLLARTGRQFRGQKKIINLSIQSGIRGKKKNQLKNKEYEYSTSNNPKWKNDRR